jgi:hypothetical protein
VQVDDARGYDQAVRVDHLARLIGVDATDRGDDPVANRDVAAEARRAAAVDDHAVLDHPVIAHQGRALRHGS